MPKSSTENSTTRRHKLAAFIDDFGETMVKSCSTCRKHKRVCKVHTRSGKCSECLRRGQRCDVRVTQSEWERLKAEKTKLRREIQEAYETQERARDELRAAFAKEMRLRQQMDLLDKRAEEAIAVEEANIEELERDEALELEEVPGGLALGLSPQAWSALDGFPASFWETPIVFPDEIGATTAGNS